MSEKIHWMCEHDDCEAVKVGTTKYCMTHLKGLQKVTRDLKRQKEKRFIPISKMSQKRAEEMAEYIPLREEYLKQNPDCAFKFEGCTGKATDIHHRSMSADDFLIVDTWLGGCRHCHTICENMPAEERRTKLYLIEPTKKQVI